MTKRRLPPLGTVFLVPLRDSGYATGVLARASGKGPAFGYFFGPRVHEFEEIDFALLTPENSVLTGQFGDLELLRGKWPIGPVMPGWEPSDWPMLPMARVDEGAGRAWLSSYDDNFNCVNEVEIPLARATQFPYDRLMGAGATEIRLTRLIGEQPGATVPST